MSRKVCGESKSEALKSFYLYVWSDENLQKKLIKTKTRDEFINACVDKGSEYGYSFTKEEMSETVSKFAPSDTFKSISFSSPWKAKLMEMGWSPMGYSQS